MYGTSACAEHTTAHAATVKETLDLRQHRQPSSSATYAGHTAAYVYLIANPVTRKSTAWPKIRADLTARVKSAALAEYSDLFADGADYKTRWPQIVGQLAGAVVVPRPIGGGLMLGLIALREAEEISAAGKPVLIYTRQGLFRWAQADAKIHGRDRGPFRVELIIPRGAR